ncbi:hypothetical protein BvCmsNSP001_04931 [Escherichia coli]|nr:hypothetical protein BvCmsNSP001_04931 [Escherichia coli]
MLLRPTDKLGTNVTVLHLQRTRAWQFNGTTNPPPFAGNGVQRILTKGAIAQQAGFPLQPGRACRLSAGLQDQLFQRRNTLKRRAALQRHIFQLAAVIKRHHAQLRPFAAAGGHPVQMVKTRVNVRARNERGAGEVIIQLNFARHRRCTAVARDHQRPTGVGVAARLLPALVVQVTAQQARHKRISRAKDVKHLHTHAGHRQAVIQPRWNGIGIHRTAQRAALANQCRLADVAHLRQRLQRIGAASRNVKLLFGADNDVEKV